MPCILKAVVEKKMKARGPGWPWGKTMHPKTPAVVYDIKEWMWDLTGDSNEEPKWNDMNHRPDWWSNHSQWRSQGWTNLWHSIQMTVSRESGQLGWTGRGFRVNVNLPTFKDEKAKDAVAYHSWQWDVSLFCCYSWDDHHLLPYVIRSLQGFLGDLVRSLGEDTGRCPPNIGQTQWCHDNLWHLK